MACAGPTRSSPLAPSQVLPIDTANLVAVVLALLVPVFGGFVRNLGEGVKKSTYSWWANEASGWPAPLRFACMKQEPSRFACMKQEPSRFRLA